LLTEVGPVDIEVPRDRDGSFAPVIVRKRQRRLGGVEDLIVSLTAKGLTTGEVCAHLAEVYGVETSKDQITAVTDRVMDTLGEWQNRSRCQVCSHQRLVRSGAGGFAGICGTSGAQPVSV
jgi:transposase-like protein